jgi:hypothetical protein
LQSTPQGIPGCVNPKLDKTDLERLIHDIPKYDSAGLLHAQASAWWTQFLANFEHTYGSVPCAIPAWPLDDLRNATVNVVQNDLIAVPEKISALHSTQMEHRPKVIFHMHCISSLHCCTCMWTIHLARPILPIRAVQLREAPASIKFG